MFKRIRLAILISFYAVKGSIIRKRHGDIAYFRLMQKWAKSMISAAGIEMVVEGIENLEPDEIYIYVANHTSLFDIPVLAYAIPDTICFMYKKELLDIPMLGFGLRHSPYIPIERENPKHAVSSISKAIKAVNSTGSVVLFPEGTRSTDGKVGAFKRGAFAIAGKSNKKIVPISIIGMNKILSAGNLNLKSGRVKVIINPPVDRVPDDKKSLQEFIDNLHGIIAQQVSDEKNIL